MGKSASSVPGKTNPIKPDSPVPPETLVGAGATSEKKYIFFKIP
jgi:hypothetical protein